MPLLLAVVVPFLVFSLPPYFALDPAKSRIPVGAEPSWYFPVLLAHIAFASIAMVTACLQIWPWLRRHHPVVHRRAGRVYVLAGVLPAGTAALLIGSISPFGPLTRVSDLLLGVLWISCTLAGIRAARQRRFGDHRRWMVRSFALTMSIITNRVTGAVGSLVLSPQLDTTFGGSEIALGQTIAGISSWLGWVTALLLAQWWLERAPGGGRKARPGFEIPAPARTPHSGARSAR
jgi:uncharacterized membrane protein